MKTKQLSTNGIHETPKVSLEDFLLELNVLLKREAQEESFAGWAANVLTYLAEEIEALEAAFYYLNEEETHLEAAAHYTFTRPDKRVTRIAIGHGVTGTCIKQGKRQSVHVSDKTFSSYSGTVGICANRIEVFPLINLHKPVGVLEFLFHNQIDSSKEQLLLHALPFVASALDLILKEKTLRKHLKVLQHQSNRLEMLDEIATEGLVFTDKRTIIEHNKAFSQILCAEYRDLSSKSLYEFLDPNLISFLIQSEVPFHEVAIQNLNGETIFTEWTSRRVTYADRLVYVLSVRDISKRKQAEQQVEAQAEQLEEARQIIELNKEIEKRNTKINASLFYAKRIQTAMLPRDEVFSKLLPQSFVFFKPRDVVSGDFYWITQKETEHGYPLVIVAAIDCTGHGVPGAFMSMTGDALLNSIINTSHITQPDKILSHLHRGIRRTFKQATSKNSDGMDMSLCVLNYETNELSFAGANSPLIFIQENESGQVETNYIKGDKKPIGGKVFPNEPQRVFTTHTVSFQKSMTCYIFSDGYQDQFGGTQGRKFMGRRLRSLFTEIHQKPFAEQHHFVEQNLKNWMGTEKQIDDILLIGFKAEAKQ